MKEKFEVIMARGFDRINKFFSKLSDIVAPLFVATCLFGCLILMMGLKMLIIIVSSAVIFIVLVLLVIFLIGLPRPKKK